ncbi:MAG: histidine triad nucleotide-binding protein [bacterium]
MADCLFCKILKGEIPASKVFEDDDVLAFNDINPQAPTHILIIPKVHIPTLNDLKPGHDAIVGKLHRVAADLAKNKKFSEVGYRTVFNCNRGAGQAVYHIHLHLLGGRDLTWPPG